MHLRKVLFDNISIDLILFLKITLEKLFAVCNLNLLDTAKCLLRTQQSYLQVSSSVISIAFQYFLSPLERISIMIARLAATPA